jgi:hypothetical protein
MRLLGLSLLLPNVKMIAMQSLFKNAFTRVKSTVTKRYNDGCEGCLRLILLKEIINNKHLCDGNNISVYSKPSSDKTMD